MSEPLDRLVRHAHETRVVVVGGGGLGPDRRARECAKVGLQVTVLEASDVFGGVLRTAEVGGTSSWTWAPRATRPAAASCAASSASSAWPTPS